MITKKRELSCVHAASVPGARLEVHAAAMALELRAGMRVWLVGKDGSSDPFLGGVCESVQPGGTLKLKMDAGGEMSADPQKCAGRSSNAPHWQSLALACAPSRRSFESWLG